MDRETVIRDRAYRIWEDEGRPDGKAEDHWNKAREQVEAEQKSASAPGGTKKPAARKPRRNKSDSPAKAGKKAAVTGVSIDQEK